MKEKKKFLVFGGYVECRDGDVHYVPLIELQNYTV